MIRLVLLLLLVGFILAIRYLPWWALLAGPVLLVVLIWLLRGRIFWWLLGRLFMLPFKAKGRVLRRAVGMVYLVTLITARTQTGPAGDATGVGVVFDRPHLAGVIGGADHVDAGERQQQDVGSADQACGDVALQAQDFLGFAAAVVVQGQGDQAVLRGRQIGRGGAGSPLQDALNGAALIAHACLIEAATQPGQTRGGDVVRRGEVLHQVPGTVTFPELVEASGEAREGSVEVFADLTADQGGLEDEIAAMADKEFQGRPCLIEGVLDQGEAVDGSSVDGRQIGVIGLVTGIAGLAKVLGHEGVNDANLEASTGKSALHGPVIAAGAFHRDEDVVNGMLVECLLDLGNNRLQAGAVVLDNRGRHENVPVEVAQHPLGAGLGTINADDAEVFGSYLLDARVDDATRLL